MGFGGWFVGGHDATLDDTKIVRYYSKAYSLHTTFYGLSKSAFRAFLTKLHIKDTFSNIILNSIDCNLFTLMINMVICMSPASDNYHTGRKDSFEFKIRDCQNRKNFNPTKTYFQQVLVT